MKLSAIKTYLLDRARDMGSAGEDLVHFVRCLPPGPRTLRDYVAATASARIVKKAKRGVSPGAVVAAARLLALCPLVHKTHRKDIALLARFIRSGGYCGISLVDSPSRPAQDGSAAEAPADSRHVRALPVILQPALAPGAAFSPRFVAELKAAAGTVRFAPLFERVADSEMDDASLIALVAEVAGPSTRMNTRQRALDRLARHHDELFKIRTLTRANVPAA